MVAVQAAGCQPLVLAFLEGAGACREAPDPRTFAAGLRVPKPFADWLILRILRETNGIAVAETDEEIRKSIHPFGADTGVFLCPEGAACFSAALRLKSQGWIRPADTVVLFNTGTGLKYLDVLGA